MRDVLDRLIRDAFVNQVERDHGQSDAEFLRRRIVVGVTLVAGAVLLGFSLSIRPGDPLFYPMTFGVAVVWVAGSLTSGPLHLGRLPIRGVLRRPVLTPVLTGLVLAGVFVVGALVVRQVPILREYADSILDHARYGSLPLIALITLVNGVAEEVFFRGALFAAIGRRYPVVISTCLYALATVVTANPMLVFAAALVGVVVGLQRRASGGMLASTLTHITWSTTMLFVLPPLIGG